MPDAATDGSTRATAEGPARSIAVNQLGYRPAATKIAAVSVSGRTKPLEWSLVDGEGTVVAQGVTTVFGPDIASNDTVHHIDFSSVQTEGDDFVLAIADVQSAPFAIAPDIYSDLTVDAMRFFYHQRSGMPIEMPYAGDPKYTHGAGHPGDAKVECLPELDCNYTLDVRGGWYDAGDHGKYVVNGGISAWTLLNAYERAVHAPDEDPPFGDGSTNIPESGNGLNDLLDEARWEVEFLLRMQVPETAEKWAGMAFHKVHDLKWSGLPTNPAQAKGPRYLHRPSTAATLNLAAVAAQAGRIWKGKDDAFAIRCTDAAKTAYAAAKAHADMFATADDHEGGGPYDDNNVADEFYWAQVELYLTTGDDTYLDEAERYEHHAAPVGDRQTAMTWQTVDVLGTISLATVPGADTQAQGEAQRALVQTADAYLETIGDEGYRTPLSATDKRDYPWGSNSMVLNNAIVLALAHQFTGKEAYLQGALEGMDYIMGRNPMLISYVTGYGERPVENPHHRFWAHQLDATTPEPPAGIVSGGPNSSLQDPYAQNTAKLGGCAPQKCFVDHIESWSTNEITINWNAPLVWLTSYIEQHA